MAELLFSRIAASKQSKQASKQAKQASKQAHIHMISQQAATAYAALRGHDRKERKGIVNPELATPSLPCW
jgi:hypothetical protein